MELERLLPLLVIWIIWRILNRKSKTGAEKTGPLPGVVQEEIAELEPVTAPAPLSPQPIVDTEEQPQEMPPVIQPVVRPARCGFTVKCPDRDFLQQAVVWSEILAPPVSLRDDC